MKIKICGLTSPKEAGYLNINKVDYAGMVLFFPKSKRNIDIKKAEAIRSKLDKSIKTVAVTVSPDEAQIQAIERSGFDLIQIHGSIPDELWEKIHIPVLKAFNVHDLDRLDTYKQNDRICGYLIDASEPGSGKTFDWSIIKNLDMNGRPFFLAGGLTPDNVADAVNELHPYAVDVSSGVEYTDRPGKDPSKIGRFVKNCK
ncbi:MAG: phosphoribosylanthranilate isomerase [Lachnospiraceae bacterium]|nr:phosphoribosylanthranilate isomerase [Lachnospiraceae bacterium]